MSRARLRQACPALGEVRRWLRLLFCLTLALAPAGCSLIPATPPAVPGLSTAEPSPELEPSSTPLPPGMTAIVFWEPFPLDRPQGQLLGEMMLAFEAANPDIQVELVPKNGYLGVDDAMQAALVEGGLPDVAVAFPSMISRYASAGVVASLEPFIADPEVGMSLEEISDINPGSLAAGRLPGFGGELLAFPFEQNAIGMWVNDSLLMQAGWEHPPRTWSEFEQSCLDVWGSTGVRCYPYIESVTTFTAWLYSRGGQPVDDSGTLATFNTSAGVQSLAMLRRLSDAGLAWRPEDPYGDYVAFANGQATFTFSSTGLSSLYVDAYQTAVRNGVPPFEWHQDLIPQDGSSAPETALFGTSFFVMRGSPERERASWRLIRWFTQPEQAARWASLLQALPVRASAIDVMTGTLQAYPFVREQVEQILPSGQPELGVPAELDIREILYTAIVSVTQYYADPQVALDQAASEVDQLLSGSP